MEILKFLIPVVVALIGGWFVHKLASERDIRNKRREIVSAQLMEAYQQLSRLAGCLFNEQPATPQALEDFNYAIMKVQMFGTPRQIELALVLARAANGGNVFVISTLEELLWDLRAQVREELGLTKVKVIRQMFTNVKLEDAA